MGLVIILLAVSAIWIVTNNKKQTEIKNGVEPTVPVSESTTVNNVFASGKLSVVPVEEGTVAVGGEYNVKVVVDGMDQIVNGLQTRICYGPQLTIADIATDVTAAENNEILMATESEISDKKCVDIAAGASIGATLKTGAVDMVNIKFQTVAAGTDMIVALAEDTIVSGENPGSNTNQIEMSNIENLSYSITE